MVNIPLAICLEDEEDTISFKKCDPLVQIIPFLRETKLRLKYGTADRDRLTEVIEQIKKNKNFYKDQVKTNSWLIKNIWIVSLNTK